MPACQAGAEGGDGEAVFHRETPDEAAQREAASHEQSTAGDDGVPGELAAAEGTEPASSAAAVDCVFIQWCNEPGSFGTICQIRSSCCNVNFDENAECIKDALAVCGEIIQPAKIRASCQ
jgi:hypothetical protein